MYILTLFSFIVHILPNIITYICTVFEIIDGAQIILKSHNEATAHDHRSASSFTSARLSEKLNALYFVLFRTRKNNFA